MTNFHQRCYDKLLQVPEGKVTTYKELAKALGSKGYRAVGNAMNRNPNAPEVPCHRVVRSDGSIGGYAYGPNKKIALLREEGVNVAEGKVQDLAQHLHRFRKYSCSHK